MPGHLWCPNGPLRLRDRQGKASPITMQTKNLCCVPLCLHFIASFSEMCSSVKWHPTEVRGTAQCSPVRCGTGRHTCLLPVASWHGKCCCGPPSPAKLCKENCFIQSQMPATYHVTLCKLCLLCKNGCVNCVFIV